jgi:hypothetical protein
MKRKRLKSSNAKSTKGKSVPKVRLMRGRAVMTKAKGGK